MIKVGDKINVYTATTVGTRISIGNYGRHIVYVFGISTTGNTLVEVETIGPAMIMGKPVKIIANWKKYLEEIK